jgi:hypothetical protein
MDNGLHHYQRTMKQLGLGMNLSQALPDALTRDSRFAKIVSKLFQGWQDTQ